MTTAASVSAAVAERDARGRLARAGQTLVEMVVVGRVTTGCRGGPCGAGRGRRPRWTRRAPAPTSGQGRARRGRPSRSLEPATRGGDRKPRTYAPPSPMKIRARRRVPERGTRRRRRRRRVERRDLLGRGARGGGEQHDGDRPGDRVDAVHEVDDVGDREEPKHGQHRRGAAELDRGPGAERRAVEPQRRARRSRRRPPRARSALPAHGQTLGRAARGRRRGRRAKKPSPPTSQRGRSAPAEPPSRARTATAIATPSTIPMPPSRGVGTACVRRDGVGGVEQAPPTRERLDEPRRARAATANADAAAGEERARGHEDFLAEEPERARLVPEPRLEARAARSRTRVPRVAGSADLSSARRATCSRLATTRARTGGHAKEKATTTEHARDGAHELAKGQGRGAGDVEGATGEIARGPRPPRSRPATSSTWTGCWRPTPVARNRHDRPAADEAGCRRSRLRSPGAP